MEVGLNIPQNVALIMQLIYFIYKI